MFVTPITVIPNAGSDKAVERKHVHLPHHVVASTGTQLLPQPLSQASTSSSSLVPPRDFALYFIFEDLGAGAGAVGPWVGKFMKYVLHIRSGSCTVSQQKAAWAYLLNHIVLKKNSGANDRPYADMANCMRTVYFNKFRSTLETSTLFPILKSFTLLDSSAQIMGFDVADPFQGSHSIIEHFTIRAIGNATSQPRGVPAKLPADEPPKKTSQQSMVVKLPKKPPQTVKEVLDAKREKASGKKTVKKPVKKPVVSSPRVPQPSLQTLQKIKPKVTSTSSIPIQASIAVTSTVTSMGSIISTGPIFTATSSGPILAGTSTSTMVANTLNSPMLSAGVNGFPLNFVQLQPQPSDKNSGADSTNDDNVINLDEYNKSGGMLAVQDLSNLNKMMLGSMSITVPVIPLQGVIPLHNYQEIASSDSPFFRIATQDCQTKTLGSQPSTVSSVQVPHSAQTIQGINMQNVVMTAMPQTSTVVHSINQSGSSGLAIKPGQTTIGQVPMNLVATKSKKRKNTIKEALGPTLNLNQLSKLQGQAGMAGKALMVQGTKEMIIVGDAGENNITIPLSKAMNSNKQQKSIDLEISVSKFRLKKEVPVPPPHHLSLFDSSILKKSSHKVVTDPREGLELDGSNARFSSVEQDQNEPLNFSSTASQKALKRTPKIRDMIDLTDDLTLKSVESIKEEEEDDDEKPIDLRKESQEAGNVPSTSNAVAEPSTQSTSLYPGLRSSNRKILPKPAMESTNKTGKLKRVASSDGLEMPPEKMLKLDGVTVKVESDEVNDEPTQQVQRKGRPITIVKQSDKSNKTVSGNLDESMSANSKAKGSGIVMKEKTPPRTVYTIAKCKSDCKSPSKHVPCIISNKGSETAATKTESEENSKRMTASNRWKFSKQRVHVAKREVMVETQHDLLIQPEPMTRRKTSRRKVKKEVFIDEEEDIEEEDEEPKPEKTTAKKPKQKSPDKKSKPPPTNAFREEKIGNKVYTWVPMKRRIGIMSAVDKDGNKVYKSKAKTNKFFSISKKRMMDLGLRGNEGRPLSPASELENRKREICKSMKISDLVDKTNEQAVFLELFGLISRKKLDSACADTTEGRTSRRRQIKAPSRYDL